MDTQALFFLITVAFIIVIFICVQDFGLGIKIIAIVSTTLLIFSVLHREYKEFADRNPTLISSFSDKILKFKEYIVPKSMGNNTSTENCVSCAGTCNQRPPPNSPQMNSSQMNFQCEPFDRQPIVPPPTQYTHYVEPQPDDRARANIPLVPQRKPIYGNLDDRMAQHLLSKEKTVEAINRNINGNKYRKEKYFNPEFESIEKVRWWEDAQPGMTLDPMSKQPLAEIPIEYNQYRGLGLPRYK
jgi:hypothetical protein